MATFHDKHGPGVTLSENKTLATGGSRFASGVVFSAYPIRKGEITNLKVEDKARSGEMCIGLTAQDPVRYKGEFIWEIPQTWCIVTNGEMYHDGRRTQGVCPSWDLSKGDKVSIQWKSPKVTVYKNTSVVHSCDIEYTGKVWMMAALDWNMRLRISGPDLMTGASRVQGASSSATNTQAERHLQAENQSLLQRIKELENKNLLQVSEIKQIKQTYEKRDNEWRKKVQMLQSELQKSNAKEQIYTITSSPRGLAVIVNIYRVAGLPDIPGAKVDQKNMEDLWKYLGFKTEVMENMSALGFQHYLEAVKDREELKDISCFVLVLMSHGGKGQISGADGQEVKLAPIFWKFSNDGCKNLIGKPKLIFIEACRGAAEDTARPNLFQTSYQDQERFPAYSDMIVAYSSSPGYTSHVDPATGSYFTQSVCKVFREQHKKLDVLRIMSRVLAHVHTIDTQGHDRIQGPVWESTLRKDLWL